MLLRPSLALRAALIAGSTGALLILCAVGWPSSAQAGIDACGNIHVEANASCELVVDDPGGCEVMCEDLGFRASCAAELYAECEGTCTAEVTEVCMQDCDVTVCETECMVDPGGFNCRAQCNATIDAECSARCEAMATGQDARADCEASCAATYSAECEVGCEGRPPSVTCTETCEQICVSRCRAESTVDCQVECQAGGYVDCEAEVQGSCEADCRSPEGALICDSSYVDHGDNLQMCIEALQEELEIETETSASSSCETLPDGTVSCGGMASASASCAVHRASGGPPTSTGAAILVALVAAGLGVRRRRS
jgi:MYXO-CTERM domain-containing protein